MTVPPSQQRLAQAFVDLAACGVTEPDRLLTVLADHGNGLLGDCAAIVLYTPDERTPVQVAGTVDALIRLAYDAIEWGEGPGPQARGTGRPVPDTALDAERTRRDWPRYTSRALALGYGRVVALPLRVGEETLGALVLLGPGSTPLDPALPALGQALTDAAGWALERDRALRESRALADQLGQALTSRIVIEQAKGMLAGRLAVSVDEAFHVLRGHARSHRRRLTDVAADVVRGRLDLGGAG
ncbi:GAF and ANTAR domain-containing protein [Streptomyces sp. S3(2020)]|uniref:GAF and ANTAR domain-containing protein n=1 Tax=Streptomyces sp. S3(2020) TaxID=2732044 RepID=UPI001489665A|nr:GAF and ANTAR domain-containing protein [Streptomyces sp. S3(2020)]NNN37609.1 GAF and ANTAR domain-containing protein [Streptomyces sp. S3(2020)]